MSSDPVYGEIVDMRENVHAIEQLTRAEVDIQIATAKKYPRSIDRFRRDALSMATVDEEVAESCFYAMPREGKSIEGPSARLAEIVANCWGNMRAEARIVDETATHVVARGVCFDLERNYSASVEVRRRIVKSDGRTKYSPDMIGVTANAACSIALRNAVFKVVPMAYVKPIYEMARATAIGNAETLVAKRTKMLDYFGKMGVRPEQVCAAVGVGGPDDIGLTELATLKGWATAIREGDMSVDEAFRSASAEPAPTGTKSERLAAKHAPKQTPKPVDQPGDGDGGSPPPPVASPASAAPAPKPPFDPDAEFPTDEAKAVAWWAHAASMTDRLAIKGVSSWLMHTHEVKRADATAEHWASLFDALRNGTVNFALFNR